MKRSTSDKVRRSFKTKVPISDLRDIFTVSQDAFRRSEGNGSLRRCDVIFPATADEPRLTDLVHKSDVSVS